MYSQFGANFNRGRRFAGELAVIRFELLLRRCGPRLHVSAHACGARPPLSAKISRAASSVARAKRKRNRRGRGVRGEVFAHKFFAPNDEFTLRLSTANTSVQ